MCKLISIGESNSELVDYSIDRQKIGCSIIESDYSLDRFFYDGQLIDQFSVKMAPEKSRFMKSAYQRFFPNGNRLESNLEPYMNFSQGLMANNNRLECLNDELFYSCEKLIKICS